MSDLGKLQDDLYEHLRAFPLPEAHALVLSGLILAEIIQPLLTRERAAAEAAAYARAAQVAEQTTREPMDYIDWSPGPAADDRALHIAAAIRALK